MEDLFYSEQHRNFYRLHVDGGADPYYRALVYLLGMTEETRANFSRCFDGEARMIRPAALGLADGRYCEDRAHGLQSLERVVLRVGGGRAGGPDVRSIHAGQSVLL